MSRTQAWREASGVGVVLLLSMSLLLSGCAKMPASSAANPPSASQTPVSTPTATAAAPPTATTPTDPLAAVDAKTKKEFGDCLTKYVRVGPGSNSSGKCAALVLKKINAAGLGYKVSGKSVTAAGANAILNYQRSRGLTADAYVGKDTWIALATNAPSVPATLPDKCNTTAGVILCVDLAHRKLSWIKNGKVVKTFAVRPGGWNKPAKTGPWRNFPTAPGTFKVFDKQASPASDNYGAGAMPYATMFHPDMYVHYSAGFNNVGYSGASHGCVNIRTLSEAIWIFKNTPIGATVYIYATKKAATTEATTSTSATTTP
jgi:lipoprotein-anchoring transpeptidase ErfK/SrfK